MKIPWRFSSVAKTAPNACGVLRDGVRPRPVVIKWRRTLIPRVFVTVVALIAVAGANASGGTGEYRLDWPVKGEILAYHSCGCADSCWVAEVRSVRSKSAKARLRCDCERLLFSRPPQKPEQVVADSCSRINDSEDKPKAILEQMNHLLREAGK